MTYRLGELRRASSLSDTLPEVTAECRARAESLLLQAIETLHVGALTDAQRQGMAEALTLQLAATAVLRGFPLGNDDAPCFVTVPTKYPADA